MSKKGKGPRRPVSRPAFMSDILLFLCLFLIAVAPLAPCSAQSERPKKPNLVFFLGESMRPMDFAAYNGFPDAAPNLNAILESKGTVRVEQMHAAYPMCNPGRTSMLLGRSSEDIGVKTNFQNWKNQEGAGSWVSLPRFLQSNGYYTASGGKVFHRGTNDIEAWTSIYNKMEDIDEFECVKDKQAKDFPLSPTASFPRMVGCRTPAALGTLADIIIAQNAVNQINKIANKREERTPFALFVGFQLPHYPIRVAAQFVLPVKKFADRVPKNEPPRDPSKFRNDISFDSPKPQAPGKTAKESDPFRSQLPAGIRGGSAFEGPGPSKAHREALLQIHLSGVRQMDHAAGLIINALKAQGFFNETLIVFVSDHSVALGETRLLEKDMPLDIASRVPFFVHMPWSSNPSATTGPTFFMDGVDIYKTIVSLLGINSPLPQSVRGRDLSAVLLRAGSQSGIRTEATTSAVAFSQVVRCSNIFKCDGGSMKGVDQLGFTVRTTKWRYTVYMSGVDGINKGWSSSNIISEELYDHTTDAQTIYDPAGAHYVGHEFDNLAYDLPEISNRMFTIVKARFEREEYLNGLALDDATVSPTSFATSTPTIVRTQSPTRTVTRSPSSAKSPTFVVTQSPSSARQQPTLQPSANTTPTTVPTLTVTTPSPSGYPTIPADRTRAPVGVGAQAALPTHTPTNNIQTLSGNQSDATPLLVLLAIPVAFIVAFWYRVKDTSDNKSGDTAMENKGENNTNDSATTPPDSRPNNGDADVFMLEDVERGQSVGTGSDIKRFQTPDQMAPL